MTEKYKICSIKSRKENKVTNHEITWSQLKKKLSTPVRTSETFAEFKAMEREQQGAVKDVGAFIAGRFRENTRSKLNLTGRCLLALDLDHCPSGVEFDIGMALDGTQYILYSTHSHSSESPRLRVVVPLSRDCSTAEYEPLARLLADRVGIDWFDDTTYQPSRIMYYPSAAKDGDWLFESEPGKPLDVDGMLSTLEDYKDPQQWPISSREQKISYVSDGSLPEDPKDKPGMIGAFCRIHDIHSAIDTYLEDKYYASDDTGDRYTYHASSSVNGAVVYDNTWLYSHHESDPVFARLCNAFDLVRLHLFADLDVGNDSDEVTDLPSYSMMMGLCQKDTEVMTEKFADVLDLFDEEDGEHDPSIGTTGNNDTDTAGISNSAADNSASIDDEDLGSKEKSGDTVHAAESDSEDADPEKPTKLKQYLERFVFIADDNRVCDLQAPAERCIKKLVDFQGKFTLKVEVKAPTNANPLNTKVMPLHQIWYQSTKKLVADGEIYNADNPARLIRDDSGLWAINTFHMPYTDPMQIPAGTDKLQIFTDHMAYLFPIKEERTWFLDWMAFNLQNPGLRCNVSPLHVAVEHGTGRGWLVRVLRMLLGVWNCKKTKIESLAGDGNQAIYNDCLHQSLLCCVEEVRGNQHRYTIDDNIRDLLESDYLELNLKYGMKGTFRIHTNFFFMSNHPDAFVLKDEDRRINVFTGPPKPLPNSYYVKLYAWIKNHQGISQLARQLLLRDISDFDYIRPMDTQGRRDMIENTKSETEQAFESMMADPPALFMLQSQIINHLESQANWLVAIDPRQVSKLLQHKAKRANQGKKIRIGKNMAMVWQLGPCKPHSLDAIKEIVNSNEEDKGQ